MGELELNRILNEVNKHIPYREILSKNFVIKTHLVRNSFHSITSS